MSSTSPAERPGRTCDLASAPCVAQFYFDVPHRRLACLNDAARQFRDEGVPLVGPGPSLPYLHASDGGTVGEEQMPLLVAVREGRPVEADFLLALPGQAERQLHHSASPLLDPSGRVVAVLLSVVASAPPPDWEALAGLAHDLRSPLQTMVTLLHVLNDRSLAQRQDEHLRMLRSAAERGQQIARDLLDWCRAPGVRGRGPRHAWFALESFLNEMLAEQRATAGRKALRLAAEVGPAKGWEICTDRVRLGRILANLLGNAVRYTPPSGEVTLRVAWEDRGPDRFLALDVRDTGAGIAPEEQESIFHPFERGQVGRESDSLGSGVGLSVVDRLTHELGLRCELTSECGRGSNFRVLIPQPLLRMAPQVAPA